jgi:small subunit ribosomal protein S14
MAKESLIQKHRVQSAKWARLIAEEKAILELPKEKREEALAAFKAKRIKNRMFKTRRYNRCNLTGRAHGYIGFFGLCRQSFREKAHRGELPGITKSSW